MVASEAASAAAIMMPDGEAIGQRDIARRAHLLALATMNAGLTVDGELLIRHHLTVEIAAHHMAHHPRSGAFPDMNLALFPIDNHS